MLLGWNLGGMGGRLGLHSSLTLGRGQDEGLQLLSVLEAPPEACRKRKEYAAGRCGSVHFG